MNMRLEKDSMGELEVPAKALYGANTRRAQLNFPISDLRFGRSFIKALGLIKQSAAETNLELNLLDKKIAESIIISAQEVIDGEHDHSFVVDIFQTGSGTSTNMNANEIIANLATEKSGIAVHPNDHVNMSQSSNDVIPTATNVAAVIAYMGDTHSGLSGQLVELHKALQTKAKEWDKVYKNGRTHLMDATPVTLGQVFGGYASQIAFSQSAIDSSVKSVCDLPIGGTAVGSGINAPNNFGKDVAKELEKSIGLLFNETENHFASQGSRDEIVELSGSLKRLAVSLFKIANDIRWMGSGPISGLNELNIPALQPGSSIMPGKVNPVIPEMMMQVATQVIGNDTAITFAAANGNFELNTMLPVMAHNILESIEILDSSVKVFREKLIDGLEPNIKQMKENTQKNPILVTALVPKIGYDTAAEVAKEAISNNKTIKEVLLEKDLLSEAEIDDLLDLEKLV